MQKHLVHITTTQNGWIFSHSSRQEIFVFFFIRDRVQWLIQYLCCDNNSQLKWILNKVIFLSVEDGSKSNEKEGEHNEMKSGNNVEIWYLMLMSNLAREFFLFDDGYLFFEFCMIRISLVLPFFLLQVKWIPGVLTSK